MRELMGIVGLGAVLIASCDRPQPVAINAPPMPYPPPASAALAPYYAAPPNASIAQAPIMQPVCTQAQAAEIVATNRTLAGSNDPCVVYWRSVEVRQHPERAFLLECNGLKAYPDPQPPGHPVPLAECDRKIREDQTRSGFPVRGMSDEQKAVYRLTWGG